MDKEVVTESVDQTRELAKQFAEQLAPGSVVGLDGALGTGKTQFTKGIANFFGINPEQVNSPTYTIINEYDGRLPLYHFDFYRLQNKREAMEIGVEEYFYGDGVCVVEWASQLDAIIPADAIRVQISALNDTKRLFLFESLPE